MSVMANDLLSLMQNVLQLEALALSKASARLGQKQIAALSTMIDGLIQQDSHVIFCGVGKSGHIAIKLAATFCSLARPAFFLHPTEALHGDLGRVRPQDILVLISKSGTTEEILKLLPFINVPVEHVIGLLGDVNSPIAKKCHVVLDCSVDKEACLNNQAPTTSSTLAMAMGDALAVLYEHKVGLSREGFALSHPGGILGKMLRMKVRDLMKTLEECPVLTSGHCLKDAILAMTEKNVGGLAILDEKSKFEGILVEGDIRRTFAKSEFGLDTKLSVLMNRKPIMVEPDALASFALELMEKRSGQISVLPVIDQNGYFLGLVRLHDLVKEGFQIRQN
ncbi:MAG: KpsF/GutQ family sugar-phosphate isomerase [Bdellovibrio sp.]|nr:KpsF/GutQ family sugar-phosphate isomerase [Bdellovibrio sp.]